MYGKLLHVVVGACAGPVVLLLALLDVSDDRGDLLAHHDPGVRVHLMESRPDRLVPLALSRHLLEILTFVSLLSSSTQMRTESELSG